WSGQVSRDLLEVRNHVTVIGVNAWGPLWDPIVSHRWDEGSIFGAGGTIWDGTQNNFVGFENSFVWMDSQFASLEDSSDAADATINVLKLPVIDSDYTLWPQIDIFPGMWVAYYDRRSGAYDAATDSPFYLSFFVITHTIHVNKTDPPSSVLGSRYL